MDFEHIKNLFKEKDLIIEKINGCSDELLKKILLSVFDKMNFIEDNLMIFSKYFDKKITYSSYYTYSENLENNLNNFNAYYEGSDKEERYMAFSLYVFGRMIDELIANVLENNEFDIDSLLGLLDIGDYYNDLLTCSTNLEKMVKKKQLDEMLREKESLSFLSDDVKYKILFTGLMADDIKNLPRHLLLQFIKKVNSPLAREELVPSSESVNHVKDAYDLNISRIHFADDYRIVYVRKYDVTAILGVVLKSGKEADYTRYDIIARRKDNLFKEMQELSDGSLSPEHQHYKIIKFLEEQQKKDMLKKQRKC